MKKPGEGAATPLSDAAGRLEASLGAYERAARELGRVTLDSRKNVERAGETLARIGQLDAELAEQVSGLVGVIASLRDRQQAEAEAVQQRAAEIVARKRELDALLERLQGLAADVRALGGLLEAAQRGEPGADLPAVTIRIGQLIDASHGFAQEAQVRGFADLAAEGHALRQQLLSVKNKVGLLQKKVPQA